MIRIAIGSAVLLVAAPALAFPACGKRDEVLGVLKDSYAEAATASGVADDGNLMEIVSSPEGTWSLLVTRPDGVSCLIAAGERWKGLPQGEPEVAETPEPEGDRLD